MNGALAFLVSLLRHKSPAIVENGGGILRNISSFIATSPEGQTYRCILRQNGCLETLLQQLKSSSLTIVSNACGTLWNLSARCPEDQVALWDLGAVPMLQSLTNSKHKTISTCSLAALKNLYAARPSGMLDMVSKGAANGIPSLHARKRRNMVREMSDQLLETPDTPIVDGEETSEDSAEENDEFSAAAPPLVNNYVEDEDPPDHPTDYSLQYQENEEAEVNEANHVDADQDQAAEAVKSYFNEGTPFDTPHGISNAASVQDLVKEQGSSGIVTPDTCPPQLYATEGTPACFSRSDSVENLEEEEEVEEEECIEKGQKEAIEGPPEKLKASSIMTNSGSGQADNIIEEIEEVPSTVSNLNPAASSSAAVAASNSEASKKVSFLPEETPLIFSRASSYESLNSFDQDNGQDYRSGYSSYVPSCVPSGRVSPSDLPDSPIQSRPYSPPPKPTAAAAGKLGKPSVAQVAKPAFAFAAVPTTAPATTANASQKALEPPAESKNIFKPHQETEDEVFEDDEGIKTFDCEGTPACHSQRASLSDITLSEDEKVSVLTTLIVFYLGAVFFYERLIF